MAKLPAPGLEGAFDDIHNAGKPLVEISESLGRPLLEHERGGLHSADSGEVNMSSSGVESTGCGKERTCERSSGVGTWRLLDRLERENSALVNEGYLAVSNALQQPVQSV